LIVGRGRDPQMSRKAGQFLWLSFTLAFAAVMIPIDGILVAQSTASKQNSPASAKQPSPFADSEALLRDGKFEEAKTKIQQELRQNPSSAEGYGLLGLIYMEEKNYPEAQNALERGVKLAPHSTRIRNDLGNAYVAQAKIDLAEKEFREVVRLKPTDRDGNYNLGLVLLGKKQAANATHYFEAVHPPDIPSQINLTRAYLEAGRKSDALRTVKALSAQNKDNVQVHFTLGVLLASEKELKTAQIELEQANLLQPQIYEILYNLGEVYLRNGDYANAELALNRALKLKPDSVELLYLLAQVYVRQSKPVDALDVLVRAHKLAPENLDIILLLARVSMSQNYYEDAIPLLESALKIAPESAEFHAALGECYFMSGRVEKAIDEFKQLIAMDPVARSYAFLGLSYRYLGRFEEARTYFLQCVKKDAHNASCLFNLGYIDEHQGNREAAEQYFQQALKVNPDHAEALLELANLRIGNKQFSEAAELLRKYVKVSHSPAPGYYKLAQVERSLHQTEAAQRDLGVFQTLAKNSSTGPYPYQNLFDYLDNRSNLSGTQKTQQDLKELSDQIQKHPDQPENLCLLAEGYLKLGQVDDARKTIAQLDQLSAGDYRTQTGIGVLLARYRLYDEAIEHFQTALKGNPDSDDVKFDLSNAYFRKGLYQLALETLQLMSAEGQRDDASLSLLGDIKAHLGQTDQAEEIFSNAIRRNPDNDQSYLSLALLELRQSDLTGAEKTLRQGLGRLPSSGKLLWGLGLVSAMRGNTAQAAERLEQAVDLLPEWAGSYSTLGVFYYETGQIDKAKEVLNRFKGNNPNGGLDVNKIEEALEKAPPMPRILNEPMPAASRQQLLQFALSLVDRTL